MRNPVAKYSRRFNRGGKHKDRRRAGRMVRGPKHKEVPMGPETMSVDELIELVKSHGYSVDALGNEDIYNLAVELYDGGGEEEQDELEF